MKDSLYQVPPPKPFPALITAITCVIFLGLALPINAQRPFSDSFDYYSAGNLTGQGGWLLYDAQGVSYSGQLLATNWYNPPLAVRFFSLPNGTGNIKTGDAYATGSLSFMFYFTGNNSGGSDIAEITLNQNATTSGNINIELRCSWPYDICSTGYIRAYDTEGGTWTTFFTGVEKETWNYFRIDFYAPTSFRLTLNDVSTGWLITPTALSFSYIKALGFWTPYFADGTFDFWVDNIGGNVINYCGENASCGFCNSSTTCADAGCYWLNETCFWFPAVETSDFNDYYASNSAFATPTAFIVGLVSYTKPFIETLGNWTSAFQGNFNLASATANGLTLGLAIPQARGYMSIINNFFIDLPVSEALITILTILILIVVFRVIKTIVNFIKP